MALSDAFIDEHIRTWAKRLEAGFAYPYRSKWPAHLFHHAPLENAVRILQTGAIKSRVDSEGQRPADVAAAGVIDNRREAHQSARLYFRPRNPTQFNIEGIRKPADCRYGANAHAPVLVMFILDAKSVLRQPGTKFCDRNAQLGATEFSDNEEWFSAIPFEKVYHEGAYQDQTIKDHRCAEVLASSPLQLADSLKWVCCRSEAERDTLLDLVGWQTRRAWRDKISVSDDLRVFEKKYPFVQEVTISARGITIRINPRVGDRADIDLAVTVHLNGEDQKINFRNTAIQPSPPDGTRWLISGPLEDGFYRVRVHIEGHLAYDSELVLGDVVF